MNIDVHAISLNFRCSRSYLSLNDKATIYLDIINNLDVSVENIIVETFFDKKFLRVVQNLFNCDNNKSSIIKIDKLSPLEHTRIESSLELYDIPKELKVSVFSKVFYNTEIEGKFIKDELETNIINIKIYNINIQNFSITSNKSFYRIGELIEYTVNVSNTGNVAAQNLIIKDFIPQNTTFIENSIKFTGEGELFYLDTGLLINKISENNTVRINFNVKINSHIQTDYIKNKIVLEYRDYSKNNLLDNIKILESNCHEIFINSGSVFSKNGAFVHKVDKEIAYLNDIISHKIIIKNENKIKIKKSYFKDEKNRNLEYIKNTLTIDGIQKNCENIYEGVILDNINQEQTILTYKTKIIDIPKSGKVDLNSKIYYTLDNEYEILKEFNDKCEENNFFIYGAIIRQEDFKRYQDKNLIAIGETFDCIIEIQNNGNLDASNLIIKENITSEFCFVEDSFFINSEKIKKLSLNKEILLGCLKAKEKITIKYKLKGNTFTKENKSLNSFLTYDCLLLNGDIIKKSLTSNLCTIKIEGADLSCFYKKVDKKLCKVNDILTFNLNLENTGNIEALDIKIKDEKNEYLEFIDNSLYLNNINLENENIYNGIWKDILEVGESINISYKIKVISLPKLNYTLSKSNLKYLHLINDKKTPKNRFIESNEIKIIIIKPNILIKDINSIEKNNKIIKYSINTNEIPFKILIKNDGNMIINEVKFSEKISNYLEFVTGSFKINEKKLDDNNFYNGFKIKNIDCQEYKEINFLLRPTNICNIEESIKVESIIKYDFINCLNNESQEETINFKEEIFIIKPNFKILKEVNKTILDENEDLTETIILSNMGNYEIENVEVILPNYNFLIPRKETLSIDNFIINEFPNDNKILIEQLSKNQIKKISLRYRILDNNLENIELTKLEALGKIKIKDDNILTNVNAISNVLEIFPVKNHIKLEQNLSASRILAGENINYFLIIQNKGNTFYKNAILNISIPKGVIYRKNTLSINNSLISNFENFNNIYIGDIKINETIKISITFNIDKDIENNLLKLNAKINGECILSNKYNNYKSFNSNELIVNVEKCIVNIFRTSNIISIQTGNRILINSVISNEGSLDLKDVVFYEQKNSHLDFVENSLKINNEIINENIYNGIPIGEIKNNSNITIECEYNYTNCGSIRFLENYCFMDFLRINPSNLNFEKHIVKSNILTLEKPISIFKNININGEIMLNIDDPNILEVSNLIIYPSITSYYPIQTIKSKSYDNQILTGKKIIIEGILEEKIEYVVDDDFPALYFLEKITPFSTFIVIPEDTDYDNIIFKCKVDELYFKATNSRKIFRDLNFMIEGY